MRDWVAFGWAAWLLSLGNQRWVTPRGLLSRVPSSDGSLTGPDRCDLGGLNSTEGDVYTDRQRRSPENPYAAIDVEYSVP